MPPSHIPPLSELTLADIPPRIGLFPLQKALLLPGGHLPLNVFEPRYISLVENALATNRTIAIIQPTENDSSKKDELPSLKRTGTLGRITSFVDHEDGCFSITLTGVCRFFLLRDTLTTHGWREGMINAMPFAHDLLENESIPLNREEIMPLLRQYLEQRNLKTNWNALQQFNDIRLLTELPMLLPFTSEEKQDLLEAHDFNERASIFFKILITNNNFL